MEDKTDSNSIIIDQKTSGGLGEEATNQDILDALSKLDRKIDEIHRLHFSQPKMKKGKDLKQKFLAEIMISPARNTMDMD